MPCSPATGGMVCTTVVLENHIVKPAHVFLCPASWCTLRPFAIVVIFSTSSPPTCLHRTISTFHGTTVAMGQGNQFALW